MLPRGQRAAPCRRHAPRHIELVRRAGACVLMVVAMALASLAVRPVAVGAETLGSITVTASYRQGEEAAPVFGDTWRLAQVASAELSADGAPVYATTSAFDSFDCDWASLGASGERKAARELGTYAQGHGLLTDGSAVTDAAGRAVFRDLAPGLYLLVRDGVASDNQTLTCDPVLVSVPLLEDGSWVFDVSAAPKFESSGDAAGETPEGPATEPQEPESALDQLLHAFGLPALGDAQLAIVLVIAAAALLSAIIAWLLTHLGTGSK